MVRTSVAPPVACTIVGGSAAAAMAWSAVRQRSDNVMTPLLSCMVLALVLLMLLLLLLLPLPTDVKSATTTRDSCRNRAVTPNRTGKVSAVQGRSVQ
jgi:hypothetical protein